MEYITWNSEERNMNTIEILHCKHCGAFIVVDVKKLWATKSCSTCESTNIEIFKADENEEIM